MTQGRAAAAVLALCAGLAQSAEVAPIRYELDVSIDTQEEMLAGTATITLRATAPAREVPLLLYRLLPVKSVRLAGGAPLAFRQEVLSFSDFAPLQVNHVVVTLPEPLPAGREVAIEVAYGGYLLGYAETGMRYIQDRIDAEFTILRNDAYAFPLVGTPSLKALRAAVPESFTYRARITAPEALVVANGGRLVGRTTSGGKATTVYESLIPSWRMDFAIGRYALLEDGPIRIFHLVADVEGGTRVLAAAKTGFALLSSWLGPLPGDRRLTFLEIPDGWGSQTDVTAIIQTAAAFRDPARMREVHHELSHLWDPPPLDRPAPRWNEGLATFLQDLVDERVSGTPRVEKRAEALLAKLKEGETKHPEWSRVPMVRYGAEGMTDLSYSVGGLMFHLLHLRMGEERFFRALRDLVVAHRAGVTSEDLAKAMRAEGGAPAGELLDEWLFTARWVARVRSAATPADLLSPR